MLLFRKQLKIPGNYHTPYGFQVVSLYFEEKNKDDMHSFQKLFMERYMKKILTEKNFLKLQQLKKNQPVYVQHFNTNMKYNEQNPQAENFYMSLAKNGLIFNSEKLSSPTTTKHSFRFSQLLSCRPTDPQKVKDLMVEELAQTYQPNDACIGMIVDWNSQPQYDLICSKYKHSYQFKIEKQIIAATMFKMCFDNAMKEIVLALKNSGNNLQNIEISKYRRQKYMSILQEVFDSKYNDFVDNQTDFYKNFTTLKPSSKRLIIDIRRNDNGSSQSNSQSRSESRSQSQKNDDQISQFDIEDYSDQHTARSADVMSIDINNNIAKEWKESEKKYSSENSQKDIIQADTLTTGSVIKQSEVSVSDSIERALEEYNHSQSSKQMTFSEKKKLKDFIKKNNQFFEYLKKNNQKIDNEFLNQISTKSEDDVKQYYRRKLTDPRYHFIYEKKLNQAAATEKEEKFQKWNKNQSSEFGAYKKNDFKIEKNYAQLEYKDTSNIANEVISCNKKSRSDDETNLVSVYDNPPIEEDEKKDNRNIVLAIPPEAPKKLKSIILPPPQEEFAEIPPYDAANDFDLDLDPNILGEPSDSSDQKAKGKSKAQSEQSEDKTDTKVNKKAENAKSGARKEDWGCTTCDPKCTKVWPQCKKCPNPDFPDDPACNDCKPGSKDYPMCRKTINDKKIPDCPNGQATCCIEGRPNYPKCLCDDQSKTKECCENFPENPKCKKEVPKCEPDDICCLNPSDPSCKNDPSLSKEDNEKKKEEKQQKQMQQQDQEQQQNEQNGKEQSKLANPNKLLKDNPKIYGEEREDPSVPDFPCTDPSCSGKTSPPSNGEPDPNPTPNTPGTPPGDEPCLNPPCCNGPNDPRCIKKKEEKKLPTKKSPKMKPAEPYEELKPEEPEDTSIPVPPVPKAKILFLTVSSKEAIDSNNDINDDRPVIAGIHSLMTIKDNIAQNLIDYLDKANASNDSDIFAEREANNLSK